MVKKFEDMFIRFDRIYERNGQTDGRTDRHRMHSVARQEVSDAWFIAFML